MSHVVYEMIPAYFHRFLLVPYRIVPYHTIPYRIHQESDEMHVVVDDSREGWRDALKVLLEAYFLGLRSPVFDTSRIRCGEVTYHTLQTFNVFIIFSINAIAITIVKWLKRRET